MGSGRSMEPTSFEGASLEQMRGWVESGGGAASMTEASTLWRSEKEFMQAVADDVRAELDRAQVGIESQSGEAMQSAMAPVVLWTEVASENAAVQAEQMNAQGEAFKTVESSIPAKSEEQEVPDDNMFEEGFDKVFNGGTDAEKANAANEKLRQEGVQAFDSYGSTSSSNVAASAVFTPPPEQGMNTAINQGSHTSVGQMQTASSTGSSSPAASGSSWAAGGSSGGGSVPPMGGGTGGTGGSTPGQTNPNYVGPASPGQGGPGQGGPGSSGPGNTGPGRGGGGAVLPGTPGAGSGGRGGTSGRVGSGGRSGSGGGTGTGAGRGGAGAGSGTGTGTGRGGSGGLGAGSRGGAGGLGAGGQSGVGRGGMSGVGGGSGVAGQGGATAAGGRGGTAGAMGGAGARGAGAQGEEDDEHYTPEFLKGDYGFFDEDLPKVAPPVFGDWEDK